MLEVAIAAVAGASVGGGAVALLFARRLRGLRDRLEAQADGEAPADNEKETAGPSFGEVCLAAAQAKAEHGGEAPAADREFVDGADAVLGKLLQMGYGEDPLEMRLAYLAGGADVEFDVTDVDQEDLEDLAELVGEQLGDDLRRGL